MVNDPNLKFKVRVVKKGHAGIPPKYFNYDLANSPAARTEGWIIEDPDLNDKLKAHGLPVPGASVSDDVRKEAPVVKAEPKPEAIAETKSEPKPEAVVEAKPEPEVEANTPLVAENTPDYAAMKMPEVQKLAKAKGINTFGMSKIKLIDQLKG